MFVRGIARRAGRVSRGRREVLVPRRPRRRSVSRLWAPRCERRDFAAVRLAWGPASPRVARLRPRGGPQAALGRPFLPGAQGPCVKASGRR